MSNPGPCADPRRLVHSNARLPIVTFQYRAVQRVRTESHDLDGSGRADQFHASLDLNALKVAGATDDLALVASGLLEKDVELATDTSFVKSKGLCVQQFLQLAQSRFLDRVRDLIIEFGARRPRPLRIFERIRASEFDLLDQSQGGAKVLVRLSGKSNDEIG